MKTGFFLRDSWYYKLNDPFNLKPYYPLPADDLAKYLQCSMRTAVRICQDLRPLKHHETIYLQVMIFGLIPDKLFLRQKYFFEAGVLKSHSHDLTIDISDTTAYALMRNNQYLLLSELNRARERITELEIKLGLIKTNVVQFSDYVRKD